MKRCMTACFHCAGTLQSMSQHDTANGDVWIPSPQASGEGNENKGEYLQTEANSDERGSGGFPPAQKI